MTNILNEVQDELNNLPEEEINNKIFEFNKKQHKNIGYLALLEVLLMEIDLKNKFKERLELIEEQDNDGDAIIRLYERVHNEELVLRLLPGSSKSNEFGMGYLRSLREDCHKLLSSISGYVTEISYLNEVAGEIIHKEEIIKGYVDVVEDIDINKFYNNIYKFLTEDMSTLTYKAMDIVSVIPLRITRKKYYDLLKKAIIKSLSSNSKEEVLILIERYKTIFNGTMEEDYGQRFDYYFRKTHEYKQFDFKSSSSEDIKRFYEETSKILSEIESIINIIRLIGMIVNRYIVITNLNEHFKTLEDEYQEILNLWRNYMESETDEMKETLVNKVTAELNDVRHSIKEYNINLDKLINKLSNDEGISELNEENDLIKTQNLLAYINDISIEREELLIHSKESEVDYDYLDQSVKNLIEFIERNIKTMPNIMRKVRMRRLLSLVEFPFKKPEDFFNYLKSSIEGTSREELIANINLVAEVIAKYRINN